MLDIAIVHDFLNQYGGAERCLKIFHELFPKADVYTLVYNQDVLPEYRDWGIKTSFIQNLPYSKRNHYVYLPLYPYAIESFHLEDYDLILSSSYAWAKGVRKGKNACHICYCYTPMRFAYELKEEYLKNFNPLLRRIIELMLNKIRGWDVKTADNVDHFIAISDFVAKRIKAYYKRESTIIYPPVDTDFYKPGAIDGDYFLIVSRLKPYKRIDIAVRAFNKLKLPLKIIGTGPELDKLKKIASDNVKFLGWLPDEEVIGYYQECNAFIFPGIEDFGITSVEAQSCGRPVIAYAQGGCLETVVEGKTGHFFYEHSPDALVKATLEFEKMEFNKKTIMENALRFDKEIFKEKVKSFVDSKTTGQVMY